MLRSLSQLILLAKPLNTSQHFLQSSLKPLYITPKSYFCAEPAAILKSLITKSLKYCSSFYDLFYCFDKYQRALNLTHLSIIIHKFNYFQQSTPKNPRLEAQYNEILSLVVQKLEQGEDQGDNRLLTLFYQFISQNPYHGPVAKRCIFILEQKGIAQYQQMKQSELATFVTTLASNNKKTYVRGMIPYLTENIHTQSKEKIAEILCEFTRLNLHTPELAKKVQEFCLKSNVIERLDALEFAHVFRFFSNYPELVNEQFIRKFHFRIPYLLDTVDEAIFSKIVEAASAYDQSLLNYKFYKTLENKFQIFLNKLDPKIIAAYFKAHCIFKLDNPTIASKVYFQALKNMEKYDISSLALIFYWTIQSKKLNPTVMKQFSDFFVNYGIDKLKLIDFDLIFNSYHDYYQANKIKPSDRLLEDLYLYLKDRIHGLSFHQIESFIERLSIFNLEDQQDLIHDLQKRLIKEADQINNDLDFKFIYKLVEISVDNFSNTTNQGFIHTVIDIANDVAKSELNKSQGQRNLNSVEKLAQIFHLLTNKSMTSQYVEKRGKLFRILEQLFVESYQSSEVIRAQLTESKLFIYITAFYSFIDKPTPEIGDLLQKALNILDMKRISPANIKFLFEKTDLMKRVNTENPSPI